MKTYSRAAWLAADGAWRALVTEPWRWESVRQAARERGMLYPPAGERGDSWGEREPSQFAIVARELYDGQPERLLRAIRRSVSWSDVVRHLIDERGDVWEDTELREREAEWNRREVYPDHREAAMTVGAVLRRIADSAGIVR